jgi:AcrR family transcriptional regulator
MALTRADIVAAALRVADARGLDAISVRGLADRLGVTPMALYRHVRDKDEILDAVTDTLLARLGLPPPPSPPADGWRDWCEAAAESFRRLLVDQPLAIAVFARGPVTTPAARRRLATSIEVLTAAGFGHADAVRAYAAVHTYTVGFCSLEASRRADRRTGREAAADDATSLLIRGFVSDSQFTHGLRALLAGLTPGLR